MALTISVKLDDELVDAFLKVYNDGQSEPITIDILNQDAELREELGDTILSVWADELYQAYDNLFEE
jgi:hypothetical protein